MIWKGVQLEVASALEAVVCLLCGSLGGLKTGGMAFWPNLAFGKTYLRRLPGKVYQTCLLICGIVILSLWKLGTHVLDT